MRNTTAALRLVDTVCFFVVNTDVVDCSHNPLVRNVRWFIFRLEYTKFSLPPTRTADLYETLVHSVLLHSVQDPLKKEQMHSKFSIGRLITFFQKSVSDISIWIITNNVMDRGANYAFGGKLEGSAGENIMSLFLFPVLPPAKTSGEASNILVGDVKFTTN